MSSSTLVFLGPMFQTWEDDCTKTVWLWKYNFFSYSLYILWLFRIHIIMYLGRYLPKKCFYLIIKSSLITFSEVLSFWKKECDYLVSTYYLLPQLLWFWTLKIAFCAAFIHRFNNVMYKWFLTGNLCLIKIQKIAY